MHHASVGDKRSLYTDRLMSYLRYPQYAYVILFLSTGHDGRIIVMRIPSFSLFLWNVEAIFHSRKCMLLTEAEFEVVNSILFYSSSWETIGHPWEKNLVE